jgi:DNA repair protein RadA/Sms
VGLSGELRAVGQAGTRIGEAVKLGFKKGIVPANNLNKSEEKDIEITGVKNVEEAIEMLLF